VASWNISFARMTRSCRCLPFMLCIKCCDSELSFGRWRTIAELAHLTMHSTHFLIYVRLLGKFRAKYDLPPCSVLAEICVLFWFIAFWSKTIVNRFFIRHASEVALVYKQNWKLVRCGIDVKTGKCSYLTNRDYIYLVNCNSIPSRFAFGNPTSRSGDGHYFNCLVNHKFAVGFGTIKMFANR
jgi:hypothetical protein